MTADELRPGAIITPGTRRVWLRATAPDEIHFMDSDVVVVFKQTAIVLSVHPHSQWATVMVSKPDGLQLCWLHVSQASVWTAVDE